MNSSPIQPFGQAVEPDPGALSLARDMLGQDDVMREILDETIPNGDGEKVTESGRTVCGSSRDIHGPLARFPTAVELASCPRGISGGTWHSHVTQDQLRDPTNSLPDTANVVFGDIDVSIVAGTQSAEAVVAPADYDAARAAFSDALGAEVDSTEGVVDAILDRQVKSPSDARRRVRDRLSGLFIRSRTGYGDLDSRLSLSGIPAHSPISFEMVDAQHHALISRRLAAGQPVEAPGFDVPALRERVREQNQAIRDIARMLGSADSPPLVGVRNLLEAIGLKFSK